MTHQEYINTDPILQLRRMAVAAFLTDAGIPTHGQTRLSRVQAKFLQARGYVERVPAGDDASWAITDLALRWTAWQVWEALAPDYSTMQAAANDPECTPRRDAARVWMSAARTVSARRDMGGAS